MEEFIEALQEALRIAENNGWHHMTGTREGFLYTHLAEYMHLMAFMLDREITTDGLVPE